ncbi:MAG: LysM peptidoglycan-binding domain-containing protein [Anaerolineae bacterium]|nr:LysM peptidoglycan-binding domain-containing protein [Anaerolineae bacterium]
MKPSRTQQALVGLGVLFVIMVTLLGGLVVALAEKALPDVRLMPTPSCMPTLSCMPTTSCMPTLFCPSTVSATQTTGVPEWEDTPTHTMTPVPSLTRRPVRTATFMQRPTATRTPAQTACDIIEDWVPYQVQPGDTLFLIGMRYGVRVDTLLDANCLDSTMIDTGQTIYVPPVTPRPLPTQSMVSEAADEPAVSATVEVTASTTVEPMASATNDPPTSIPASPVAVATLTGTDGACTNPDSVITSPYVGALLMGTIKITGTARTSNFASYRLEIRQEGTQQPFTTIFTGYEPVTDGTLAEFNTLDWSNGEYWLRLVVLDAQNNYPERCSILIAFYNCPLVD